MKEPEVPDPVYVRVYRQELLGAYAGAFADLVADVVDIPNHGAVDEIPAEEIAARAVAAVALGAPLIQACRKFAAGGASREQLVAFGQAFIEARIRASFDRGGMVLEVAS